MTVLPELEHQLAQAAQRRVKRQRPGVAIRRVIPAVTAIAIMGAVAFIVSGDGQSELEVSVGPSTQQVESSDVPAADLSSGPLGRALETMGGGDKSTMSGVRALDGGGAAWTAAFWTGGGGGICAAAAIDGQAPEVPVAGSFCEPGDVLSQWFGDHGSVYAKEGFDMSGQPVTGVVVFGFVDARAKTLEVTHAKTTRTAILSSTRLTSEVGSTLPDGSTPRADKVAARLFAVAFSSGEISAPSNVPQTSFRTTFDDGTTHTQRPSAAELAPLQEIDPDKSVGCYDRASLSGNTTVPGKAKDPVAECLELWRTGVVSGRRQEPPAPLVLCVGAAGTPLVFPAEDDVVCLTLGLRYPEPPPPPADGNSPAGTDSPADGDFRAFCEQNPGACPPDDGAHTAVPSNDP